MRKYKRDIIGYLFLVLATIGAFTMISAHKCATELSVAYYEVKEEKLTEPIRIVQLSDLHGHVFGENNEELAALVKAQQPDLIAMTGDMLDKQDENADVVCALIRDLQGVAPIYYCHGNHEKSWMERTGTDLNARITQAGAVMLDTDFVDTKINGQPLRIGGFHGYYRYWGMLTGSAEQWNLEESFAVSFEETDTYKILLDHIPTGWIDWRRINDIPVDLVLTGHFHGGQIRIPLIGGIYAPYVGFFPEYTEGMFKGEAATAILSTGLGSSPGIPRINNPPQIVVVDILPM